jgi:hypothetical protein
MKRLRYSGAGILLPSGPDGRSRSARRLRRLTDEFAAEVGTPLSPIDRALVAQAAVFALHAEVLQAQIVAGEAVDIGDAIRLASESRRILGHLKSGAARNKPAAPTVQDLLAEIADEDTEDAGDQA